MMDEQQENPIASLITLIFAAAVGYGVWAYLKNDGDVFAGNGAVYDALTPGLSTQEDFREYRDAGGLQKYNNWFDYEVRAFDGVRFKNDGVLESVALELSSYPAPVPKDIRARLAEICGSEMRLIQDHDVATYLAETSKYQCGYIYNAGTGLHQITMYYK